MVASWKAGWGHVAYIRGTSVVVESTMWIMLLILILNKNLVGCGVLLRDETFTALAVSAFWLESCLAPWEKEVKAFPQRNLQFPVFKVYFVNSKKNKR